MKVMCGLCDKPVDYMVYGQDFHAGTYWLEVECHGDRDRMEIDAVQMMRMTAEEVRALNSATGVAFTTKQIAQKETPDSQKPGAEGGNCK